MLGSIQTHFWAVRDYLAPVLRDSKFKESGRLTPDEFVAAGDFLVYKFPTWAWEAGEPSKRREFLPEGKQYLVQRNVPCLRRVSQLAYGGGGQDEDAETLMSFAADGATAGDSDGEEWVATHTSKDPSAPTTVPTIGDIPDLDHNGGPISSLATTLEGTSLDPSGSHEAMPDMDDIPDMDDEDEDGMGTGGGLVEEAEDDAALKPVAAGSAGADNLVQVRTYDCSITYDKYYQTPRMWLLGYDEHKNPLPPTSALEDVSADHAQKTVTIEPFPHSSLSMASVHPCKHSSVMKKVIERMDARVVAVQRSEREREKEERKEGKGKWGIKGLKSGKDKEKEKDGKGKGGEGVEDEGPEGLRVDQYLVVFLKFMSSIVPTIEVDATNAI